MDCKSIKEKLSSYLEEQLPHEERMRIDAHLKACPECSLALSDLKKTIEYMCGIEDIEPPAWLQQKVMAKIREDGERKKGIWQKLFYPLHVKVPLEALATIAVAVTAFYIFKTVQPVMKEAKAPSGQGIVSTREQEKKSPAEDERIIPPSDRGGEGGVLEAPSEIYKPKEKHVEKEAPAGAAEDHVESGKEERISQDRYKALDMKSSKGVRAPAPESARIFELKKQAMSIVLYVEDTALAVDAVEKAVKTLGGQILNKETSEGKEILTVKLDSLKVNELNNKLALIGDVKKGKDDLGVSEGELRIEIIKQEP